MNWRLSWLFLIALCLSARPGLGQGDSLDSLGSAVSIPPFQLMRSSEDYSSFANLKNRKEEPIWMKVKYLPLGNNSFVSLGGSTRIEFQSLQNEAWIKDNDDQPLFIRLMLHSDFTLGDHFRAFIQFKSGHAIGRNGPPFFLNVDKLDLHELFVSYSKGKSTIELGRREIMYGSRRLISIREGTNVRQSFDGVRWIWKEEKLRVDLLLYAYNPQEIGVFDNRINTDQLLWGGYAVWNTSPSSKLNLDLYYLGVRNEETAFEQGDDREVRHSVGIRHWGTLGPFRYNNEALYQFGTFGNGNISAWTISTELYYTFQGQWTITPGLKAEIISGDKDPNDPDLQTFNPLYPRGGYFGLLALIGPANLMDIHPSISISPTQKLSINLDWDVFWRHRTGDGIYFPSGRLNLPSGGSDNRYIGHQAGVQIGYTINRFMQAEVSYFYFTTGPFLEDVTDGANFSQFGVSYGLMF